MTREPDIVERLRDIYATHPVVMEAAAEIERLREALQEIADLSSVSARTAASAAPPWSPSHE